MNQHLFLVAAILISARPLLAEDPQTVPAPQAAANVQITIVGDQADTDDDPNIQVATATASANGNGVIVIGGGSHAPGMQIQMMQNLAGANGINAADIQQLMAQQLTALIGADGDRQHAVNQVISFSRSSSNSMINDGEHCIALSSVDGKTDLEVTTADGKPVFQGPWNTEEDKAKAPAEIRRKVDSHQNAVTVVGDAGISVNLQVEGDEAAAVLPADNGTTPLIVPAAPPQQNTTPAATRKNENNTRPAVGTPDAQNRRFF